MSRSQRAFSVVAVSLTKKTWWWPRACSARNVPARWLPLDLAPQRVRHARAWSRGLSGVPHRRWVAAPWRAPSTTIGSRTDPQRAGKATEHGDRRDVQNGPAVGLVHGGGGGGGWGVDPGRSG